MNRQEHPDKLEAGEISERSPLIAWLDNFWYHNKWTVIITAFFAVILIIGIVQMTGKTQYDAVISAAVPATPDSEQRDSIEKLFARLCPEDFNQSGSPQVAFRSWQVYSEEEYRVEKESVEAESLQFNLNATYNEEELNQFRQYAMTGESAICLVSPYVYSMLAGAERLMPLAELYGQEPLPVGSMDDGIGIRICETDLYRYNPELSGFFPDTTILCLLKPTIAGDISKEAYYTQCKQLFRALADYSLSE